MSPRKQLILGVHFFDLADSIFPHPIFRDHHVARLPDRRVWLRRHDQTERLQIRGHTQADFVRAVGHNLAQVARPALRRDRPQDVRHIFKTESLRRCEVL